METLSAAVDARDSHTAGHSRRVQTLALALGRELGFSMAEQEVLGHAALFHDVGKLAVPESILLKSEGLGDIDWVVVRRHPEEGARLIEHLGFLEDALPAIKHHHERYDGTGYPEGLAGEDIPLGARIIHLADALDAMLTSRPYRPALDPLDALEQIRSGAGFQFCPRCVDVLDRIMLAEFAKGADVPHELLAS
jgi:putative nucleotidyltransferase with HDIG domain